MERREIIKNLITPEFLRNHSKYKVLVEAIAEELGLSADNIELIPILGSPELMPDKYLPVLCDVLGIDYNYDEHVEAHRELVKRIFTALKNRGCVDSVTKAVARGNDAEFYIEDLHYYNRKMKEQYANIWPAYERIFRYSVSRLSGNHHLEDGSYWDMGFLIVECESTSENLFKKLYSVLPAGRELRVWLYVSLGGNGTLYDAPHMSWDPETGKIVTKTVWEDEGTNGVLGRPLSQLGTDIWRQFDIGIDKSATGLVYSDHGCISGNLGSPAEVVRVLSGAFIGIREDVLRKFDMYVPSHYAGKADVGLGDELVKIFLNGRSFGEARDLIGWWLDETKGVYNITSVSGVFNPFVDGGSFGEARSTGWGPTGTEPPVVDGLMYKSL